MNWHWLGNPWFVGIVGSIPSGFLVNWFTGLLLGKRENREYLQKVNGANRDIVYALRPGISENTIPTADVLSSLINATARRYRVETSDIYDSNQISEELVKEVMDSSFISSTQKAEYCERLATLGGNSRAAVLEHAKEVEPRAIAEYRERSISFVSTLLGVMTAGVAFSIPLFDIVRKRQALIMPTDDHLKVFLPVLIAVAGMMVSLLGVTAYRDVLRGRRKAEKEIDATRRFGVAMRRTPKRSKPPEV